MRKVQLKNKIFNKHFKVGVSDGSFFLRLNLWANYVFAQVKNVLNFVLHKE